MHFHFDTGSIPLGDVALQEKAQHKNQQFFCKVAENTSGGTADADVLLVNGPES